MRLEAILAILMCSSLFAESVTIHGLRQHQDGRGNWRNQLDNPSQVLRFGTPNSHFPWLNAGGIPGDQKYSGVATVKEFDIPEGKKIQVWDARAALPRGYRTPNVLKRWKFPTGTVARVRLFSEGKQFAVHTSTKVTDGIGIDAWNGEEKILSDPPQWYKPPENCVECHEDVGKHARILHPERENYYHWLAGSDGRFNWRPTESNQRLWVKEVPKELKSLVRGMVR